MIVVIVFLSILNQMDFHLVQNRKENCPHYHIPFNMKEIGNIVFSRLTVLSAEGSIWVNGRTNHTNLAQGLTVIMKAVPPGRGSPLHSGDAESCDYPKCG